MISMKLYFTLFTFLFISVTKSQGIFQLWGSTAVGGANNSGVFFSAGATGNNYQSRYQLTLKSEGIRPLYSDPAVFNGKLYGVTSEGGSNNKGTIYQWDPVSNDYFKKIDFNGNNGSKPEGSLVLYNNKFYGMTYAGGIRDSGIIFEYDPATNIFTKKIDLYNARGSYPVGNLTINNGKFYGTTTAGGTNGKGVIFEWDPVTNIFTKKTDLATTTGATAFGTLTWYGNKFYGMTVLGGLNNEGVIFEWDPATNIYTKKIDLSTTTGSRPYGKLIEYNSKLYGLTNQGGANGVGVIFEYDPTTNIYTKKIDFNFTDGCNPYGSFVFNSGKFYGLAYTGGTNVAGTIFEWDPALTVYTKKKDLYSIFGSKPYGSLLFYSGMFYGMTNSDVNNYGGLIFDWDPTADILTKRIDLGVSVNERYPAGHFIEWGGKFFEMCTYSTALTGAILEWDPANNVYTKRYDFKNPTGYGPGGSLTALNGKLYGMTQRGGLTDRGVIFEWDPVTYDYVKKIDLSDAIGSYPLGELTYFNGKFYGMTNSGGDYQTGVIFEWDPVTNIYTKKIDFIYTNGQWPMGNSPAGSLTEYNGKLYGMTNYGGENNLDNGVIFEWDPLTNVYTKKFDFNGNNGKRPWGTMTLSNGKFYGVTSEGGVNNVGVIFEWDPATSVFSKKIDFGGNNGTEPQGNLTESNGKFYGVTKGGGNNSAGLMYEWDPVTNIFVKKKDFTFSDANSPNRNYLNLFKAPLSKGTPGICAAMNSVTINSSNNNQWVAITDNTGDAVAEIKANGNNLGLVTTSLFINNKPVREDPAFRLYLDRNLSITPQVQPATPVDIRLYLKGSEFEALKNAFNSQGQPSGVNTINDVAFFKSNGTCQTTIQNVASPVTVTGTAWNNDYILTASINQFSSFYVANKTYTALPLTFLDFYGTLSDGDALLEWKTENEINTTSFEVERSLNGSIFSKIATVVATNQPGRQVYDLTDKNILTAGVGVIYYRVKQIDIDGKFVYSKIITLRILTSGSISVFPNPATNIISLQTNNKSLFYSEAVLSDIQGKKISTFFIETNQTQINISTLVKGIYMIKTIDGAAIKFIKK